jgi:hypothetical protein
MKTLNGILIITLSFSSIYAFNGNAVTTVANHKNHISLDKQKTYIEREKMKIFNLSADIYTLKPNLTIDYKLARKFGGNCEDGMDSYFKDFRLKNNQEVVDYINYLDSQDELQKILPNIKRTLVMIKHSIKSESFPEVNGNINPDQFNKI